MLTGNHHRPKSRRGVATGMLLAALVVLLAGIALVVGLGRLWTAHVALRNACEAAALAAAAELLDEHRLQGTIDYRDDVEAARQQAVRFAAAFRVDGRPVQLRLDSQDGRPDDVLVGWVDPLQPTAPMVPWDGQGAPNSVSVRVRRSELRGDPVSLFFASAMGLFTADVAAVARASLDQQIVGFRPSLGSRVPVVPLVADAEVWNNQAWAEAVPGTNDCYAVDAATGQVMLMPDGIPEIELRAPLVGVNGLSDDAAAALLAVWLLPADADQWTLDRWQAQLRLGLSAADLIDYQGWIVIVPPDAPQVPVLDTPPAYLPELLRSVAGEAKVWPLGVALPGNQQTGCGWQLAGFAAGRIMDAYIDSADDVDHLVVIVQPAMLVTSTALVDPAAAYNPWIAKLQLTQ